MKRHKRVVMCIYYKMSHYRKYIKTCMIFLFFKLHWFIYNWYCVTFTPHCWFCSTLQPQVFLFFLSGCIPGSRQRCSCAASSSAGRRPCVFSILPHLAFRHATMTQWCRVTGQAGQWLFVSIQINHSLFWTDNAINVWKGHGVRSSQAWWGEWWGQRSDGNTLDWLTCIFTRRRKKNDTKKEPWWSTFSERRD